ncbi:MAG: hypothetical protein G01um101448_19 [Parcubacteria group bacterium Gr01-1014_48]|nr:MAG: hypothetical protein Greene041614_381 [Parcubacteria group bacterium Greene0416_14]TSC74604.1 MAG: hypothetical protein G01um101448_19 [Parcubacteria group bacterium Gr01-1014_48]TSD01597.1 MAG: hypothetical protein Greene101415_177 [Parcubacteria group bacterium Greene1014_15]TSD08354.1 MAG: hypothetical protein Greene07144_149 [Parcubacteria group bacterium Greene0714_4]
MKKNIGKIFICTSAVLLFAGIANAQNTAPFCERIVNHEDAVHADLDVAAQSRTELEKEQDERLALERARQDDSFAAARLDTDAQFVKYVETLRNKARKNVIKNSAIEAFENAVITSRQTFRSAVADSIESFRESISEVIAARREGFGKAEKNRRAQFDAALEVAKNSCLRENDASVTAADDTLKTTLRGIRDGFRSEQAAVEDTARADHHQAIETRKNALGAAREARKRAVEKAVELLRAAWK